MNAKERLVNIINQVTMKNYKNNEWANTADISDAILKEFVRIEDVTYCNCVHDDFDSPLMSIPVKDCRDCKGLGWVAKGE